MNSSKNPNAGHRERIRKKFLDHGLDIFQDYEVLELLLDYVARQKDMKPVAKDLIARFGTLQGVIDASDEKLLEVNGVGEAGLAMIRTIKQVSARYLAQVSQLKNSKENIHMSINASNVEWVDDFMADLDLCVKKAKTMKSGELAVAVMEGLSSTDPSQLTDEIFSGMLSMAGIQGTQLPDRMADINEVFNVLPAAFRERLVIEFVNDLFRYQENKTWELLC